MKRLSYLVVILMLVSACSQHRKLVNTTQLDAWEQHRQQISKLHDWKITGRVGLYTDDEAWPGEIHWRQFGEQYDMRIIASLGAGTMRVHSVEGGVVLEHSSNPAPHFSPDPEALLKQQLGWQLPIRHLRYWMAGLPSPLVSYTGPLDINTEGQLNSLKQSGWLIQYKRYVKTAGVSLPAKVLMEHPELSIKIVIRKWQI